jgi:preprotein translocase subunit SecY
MFQTLKNAWKTQELKTKLLFTLLIVVLYRLGASIPVPFVTSALSDSMLQSGGIALQLIAGDAFGQATLFALSVSPYITSSIIMQLLTIAIPALERLSKEGEEGRKKISAITRYVTVGLALVTSYGYMNLLSTYGYFGEEVGIFQKIVIVACYCAGASLVMWLAEKINEVGIGKLAGNEGNGNACTKTVKDNDKQCEEELCSKLLSLPSIF